VGPARLQRHPLEAVPLPMEFGIFYEGYPGPFELKLRAPRPSALGAHCEAAPPGPGARSVTTQRPHQGQCGHSDSDTLEATKVGWPSQKGSFRKSKRLRIQPLFDDLRALNPPSETGVHLAAFPPSFEACRMISGRGRGRWLALRGRANCRSGRRACCGQCPPARTHLDWSYPDCSRRAKFRSRATLASSSPDGIPFAIKDNYDTADMRTTAGAAAAYAND
jgi:hypothetical protein